MNLLNRIREALRPTGYPSARFVKPEPALPDDIEAVGRNFRAICCRCDRHFLIDWMTRQEVIAFADKGGEWYCGGSYRCCP